RILSSMASSKIRDERFATSDVMKQLLVAFAAFLIAAPLGAQGQAQTQGQTQQPTFRTGVDVITVDVGVIDSRGQPVTDLHAPEFTVKIDGQPRRVVTAHLVKYDYTPDSGITRRPEPKQHQFEPILDAITKHAGAQ